MARIRQVNLLRSEVDTPDEVQRAFNDVYRVLREQQNEINGHVHLPAPGPKDVPAPPAKKADKESTKKESNK